MTFKIENETYVFLTDFIEYAIEKSKGNLEKATKVLAKDVEYWNHLDKLEKTNRELKVGKGGHHVWISNGKNERVAIIFE